MRSATTWSLASCVLAVVCACGTTVDSSPRGDGDGGDTDPGGPAADSNDVVANGNASVDVNVELSVTLTLAAADLVDGGVHEVHAVAGHPVVLVVPTVQATGTATWTLTPTPPLVVSGAEATTIVDAGGQSVGAERFSIETTGLAAGTYNVAAAFTLDVGGAQSSGTVSIHVVVTAAT